MLKIRRDYIIFVTTIAYYIYSVSRSPDKQAQRLAAQVNGQDSGLL